jgi:hypothetical protein
MVRHRPTSELLVSHLRVPFFVFGSFFVVTCDLLTSGQEGSAL